MTALTLGFLVLGLTHQAEDPFAGDARLDQKLSVTANAETVGKLLERLTEDGNVKLSASSDTRNDLVIAYAKDRPLGELLSKIATHFGWYWQKEGEGYVLRQSGGAKQQESRLREELLVKPFVTLQRDVQQFLSKPAADPASSSRRIKELEDQLKGLGDVDESDYQRYESLSRELEDLLQRADPITRFARGAYFFLSRAQLLELQRRGRLVISYRPTPSQHPMNRQTARAAEAAVAEIIRRGRDAAAEEEEARIRGERRSIGEEFEEVNDSSRYLSASKISPSDVATVRIVFDRQGAGSDLDRAYVSARVALLSSDNLLLYDASASLADTSYQEDRVAQFSGDEAAQMEYPSKSTQLAAQKIDKAGRLNDSLVASRRLKTAVEDVGPQDMVTMPRFISRFFDKEQQTDLLAGTGEVLLALAENARVCFISDAYDSHLSGLDFSGATVAPTSAMMFDAISVGLAADWKFDGDWVTMRTTAWPVARAMTMPRDVLFKTRDLFLAQGGLRINQTAELMAALTDLQSESEILVFLSPMENALGGTARKYLYRAWAAMLPLERERFTSGQPVAFGSLSPSVKSNLSEYLYRAGDADMMGGMFSDFEFDDADRERMMKEGAGPPGMDLESAGDVFPMDDEITQILPTGPPPSLVIRAEPKTTEAVSTGIAGFGGSEFTFSMPINMIGMMLEAEEDSTPFKLDGFRPAWIESLTMSFQVTKVFERKGRLNGSYCEPNSRPGPLESLPAATQAKIKAAREKMKRMRDIGLAGPPQLRRAS